MSEQRSQAWFKIKEALVLDAAGKDKEAFGKYLEGVQNLCCHMKNEISFSELQESETAKGDILKVLATMKESLTRLENIVSKTATNNARLNKATSPVAAPPHPKDNLQNKTHPKAHPENHRPQSLEIARRQNEYLKKIFLNRSKHLKDGSQRASLCLELQRRIQENIAVAKAKESELRARMAKEESEALHLAASKLAVNSTPNEPWSNSQSWSNKVALCASAMHYKQHESWFPMFSQQLKENPSQSLVTAVLQRILRNENHPLTIWLQGKQQIIKDRLANLLSQQLAHEAALAAFTMSQTSSGENGDVLTMFDPLQNVSGEILEPRGALSTISQELCSILEIFLQVFSTSMDLTDYPDYVDACYSPLEDFFFKDLWTSILRFYRLVNKKEEVSLSFAYRCLKTGKDAEVNISDVLCLPAYKLDEIFGDLQQITCAYSPLRKLNLLVDITHCLCDSDSSMKDEKILNADDLIGLVSGLLVQSNQPQLFSELEAIEQLLPQRFLLGEEGYSLTTFQTAIRYLESQGHSSEDTVK